MIHQDGVLEFLPRRNAGRNARLLPCSITGRPTICFNLSNPADAESTASVLKNFTRRFTSTKDGSSATYPKRAGSILGSLNPRGTIGFNSRHRRGGRSAGNQYRLPVLLPICQHRRPKRWSKDFDGYQERMGSICPCGQQPVSVAHLLGLSYLGRGPIACRAFDYEWSNELWTTCGDRNPKPQCEVAGHNHR